MSEPTEEDVERIARGLTRAQQVVLRALDDRDPKPVGAYHDAFKDALAVLGSINLATLGITADGGDGWLQGRLTDLGRRVAATLSRTGSEP